MKKSKQKSVSPATSKTQQSGNAKISLMCLAKAHKLLKNSLHFAIAETVNDEGNSDVYPVVTINGADSYINLRQGCLEKTSYAKGRAQALFPAVVSFEKGQFVFSAPRIYTFLDKDVLIEHYGATVIED